MCTLHNIIFHVFTSALTAPLVDSNPRHSSSAMLMLLSVVFLGLAVFLIYKFKRYTSLSLHPATYSMITQNPSNLLPCYPLLIIQSVLIHYSCAGKFDLTSPPRGSRHTSSRIPMCEAHIPISHKMHGKRPLNGLICSCCPRLLFAE